MDIRRFSRQQVAALIQHTNVNPDLTRAGVVDHLHQCARYGFHAAMISPCWLPLARDVLKGTAVRIATTVNFPQATDSAAMKAAVVKLVAKDGADEFDFPPNPAYLLSQMEREYVEEIRVIVKAAHDHGLIVKAMLEFGYLPDDATKRRAAHLAAEAGVDWVKNSSGWGKGGTPATVADTQLLCASVVGNCRVKVSGKINNWQKMVELFDAGAELCGTSSGVAILEGRSGDAAAY